MHVDTSVERVINDDICIHMGWWSGDSYPVQFSIMQYLHKRSTRNSDLQNGTENWVLQAGHSRKLLGRLSAAGQVVVITIAAAGRVVVVTIAVAGRVVVVTIAAGGRVGGW